MKIEVTLDPACQEVTLLVQAPAMTEEVRQLLDALFPQAQPPLIGRQGQTLEVLEEEEILRLYAREGKVFAVTPAGEYALRLRLYEAEARLSPQRFARISHAEIINLKKVRQFDLSLSGTIQVRLCDGSITYVSRRYVGKLKQRLGI